MTTDLEDRIRSSLRLRAEAVKVDVPEPDLVRPFARGPRSHRLELAAVAAALIVFVAAALMVALAGRESADPGFTTQPATSVPAVGELGAAVEPGALITMPTPWRLQRFLFLSAAWSKATSSPGVVLRNAQGEIVPLPEEANAVEYEFSDGDHSIQLNFYPLGVREPSVTTPAPPLVTVRGITGYFLDYGGGRYRIQWDESGRTWEADGNGFASLDELAIALESVVWRDDAAWSADMPGGLSGAILANPAGTVSWTADADPQLVVESP